MSKVFQLITNYKPSGDQPKAINSLTSNIIDGVKEQVLLGVTGSGKTFTIANVIDKVQKPALIMAPNKTLAAQLYGEMKEFFPNNAVEYFVSYYDYYQPEAYVPASDTYIEKDASINDHIDQMRLSATKSLLERKDVIIVASVSAIYGLGDPTMYLSMVLNAKVGDKIDRQQVLSRLNEMQYKRNELSFERSTYRVRGDILDIYPAEQDNRAIRISFFDDEIEKIQSFDPITGKILSSDIKRITIYPKSHYVTSRERTLSAMDLIKIELKARLEELYALGKNLEAERLKQRTQYDIEMLQEIGYCNGIENYSRYLSGRNQGESPPTLLDYFPKDSLLIIDESHVTVPQIGGMYKGDRARKENLVNYGFRLPSALDNRPLMFDEFVALQSQTIYVSATPGAYEIKNSSFLVQQVVRPTGLLDPEIEVRPALSQVDDVYGEILKRTDKGERVLITTLTKKMSEDLTDYLASQAIKVRYLHSDIDTVERSEIIRDLRLGVFDVLVGINLLREGLDIPEVSLVAIMDADKQGFLRSERSLIQTIGRAARNAHGKVIMYGESITSAMQYAINETKRRRQLQDEYNQTHNITPTTIINPVRDILDIGAGVKSNKKKKDKITKEAENIANKFIHEHHDLASINKDIKKLEKEMKQHATNLEFEKAAAVRDAITLLKQKMLLVQ